MLLTANLNHLLKLMCIELMEQNFPKWNLEEIAEIAECNKSDLRNLLCDERNFTANKALECILNINDNTNILEEEVLDDIAEQIEKDGVF